MRSLKQLQTKLVHHLRQHFEILEFQCVEDPRKKKNKRWKLEVFLKSALLGVLAACRNLRETEDLTVFLKPSTKRRLKIAGRVPATTMRDALVKIDPNSVRKLLHEHCRSVAELGLLEPTKFPFGILSIDGKTTKIHDTKEAFVQTKTSANNPNYGLLRTLTCCLVSSKSMICLDANPIPAVTNEMGHFQSTVKQLIEAYSDLNLFQLIRTDAGLCSRENGEFLNRNGLNYLFALNAPNSKLHKAAIESLEQLDEQMADVATIDNKGKRRSVIRCLFVCKDFQGSHGWASLKSVFRVLRIVMNKETGKVESTDNRYFISDLPWESLSPEQWLALVRDHWGIENNIHGTIDRDLKEDKRPWIVASGQGFLVVALLRRIALNILSLFRSFNLIERGKSLVNEAWRTLQRLCKFSVVSCSDLDGEESNKRAGAEVPL